MTNAEYASGVQFIYSSNGGGANSAVAAVSGNSAATTLSGLTPGTTYTAYAQATATNGSTPQSSSVSFTTQQQTTPPAFDRTWAELPAYQNNGNYIYHAHTSLPSQPQLRNYSFCLDKSKYASVWVAYPLHACYKGSTKRTDAFGYDPDISTSYQANIGSYSYYTNGVQTHSRGHQLPSDDRDYSAADNNTTFYATNMTPQLQTLNGGVWQSLESKVRGWVCSDTLYVVTGAYFDPDVTPSYVQDNRGAGKNCPIPTHYYKVLLRTKSGNTGKRVDACLPNELECIGFWFDHSAGSWTIAASIRSVAEIEDKIGIKFFVNVPNAPKSTYSKSDWGL